MDLNTELFMAGLELRKRYPGYGTDGQKETNEEKENDHGDNPNRS